MLEESDKWHWCSLENERMLVPRESIDEEEVKPRFKRYSGD
jgi:hypothetical protein